MACLEVATEIKRYSNSLRTFYEHKITMFEELSPTESNEQVALLVELMSNLTEDVKLTDAELAKVQSFVDGGYLSKKVHSVISLRAKKEAERKSRISTQQLLEQQKVLEKVVKEEPTVAPVSNNNKSSSFSDIEDESDNMSEYSTEDNVFEASSNVPRVDFLSFITSEEAYLFLKDQQLPIGETLENERLDYPLGVAYDEILKDWLICDRDNNKILRMNMDQNQVTVLETPQLKNPSAIIIFKEGRSAAVLCSEDRRRQFTIYIYDLKRQCIRVFASYKKDMYNIKFQLRGLAKSIGSNLLSLDLVYNGPKRLRVFKKDVGAKAFEMRGAVNPSFLATFRGTVAVSDLGVNKVFIFHLDDSDWDDVSFSVTRVIETVDYPVERLANESGFKFVAGMQFDSNGFLLIGDAKGHTIKLYDTEYTFLHRVSSDFRMPFMSSFQIASTGEVMILDVHADRKLHWVKLQSIVEILPWLPGHENQNSSRRAVKPPSNRRGEFSNFPGRSFRG